VWKGRAKGRKAIGWAGRRNGKERLENGPKDTREGQQSHRRKVEREKQDKKARGGVRQLEGNGAEQQKLHHTSS